MEKVEIRGHALGSEERVSEAEPSSALLIPGFSVFPDFVVFPASWSGADATHILALNTSSTPALRCFRPVYSITVSPTNTDLSLLLIGHSFTSIICAYDPAVFEPVLFQQVLHDLIIPVCVYF